VLPSNIAAMPWYGKEQPTHFDTSAINGLLYLDGKRLASRYNQEHVAGQKYPVIAYPSGLQRELWDSSDGGGIINIFGAFELMRRASRDEGFVQASEFASKYDYSVAKRGDRELFVVNPYSGRGYQITYDNQTKQIENVIRFPAEAMELLDIESRAVLPPLYANEKIGLDAIAPVKFFTPDASWTWYASEYDGEDTFFGLVSGLDVELGYFSLSELESVRGALGLPVERDLYYQPSTLRDRMNYHDSR
jgi:hypothetical protein